MSAFFLNHFDFSFEGSRLIAAVFWDLVGIAVPLFFLIMMVQRPSTQKFLSGVMPFASKVNKFLQKQIEDPYHDPSKMRWFFDRLELVFNYAMSGFLAFCFVGLLVVWGLFSKTIFSFESAGVICFSFGCIYMAAVFKAEAGKTRARLRQS